MPVRFQGGAAQPVEGGGPVQAVVRDTMKHAVLSNKVDVESERIERRRLENRMEGNQRMNEARIGSIDEKLSGLEKDLDLQLRNLREAIKDLGREADLHASIIADTIKEQHEKDREAIIHSQKEHDEVITAIAERPPEKRSVALAWPLVSVLGLSISAMVVGVGVVAASGLFAASIVASAWILRK